MLVQGQLCHPCDLQMEHVVHEIYLIFNIKKYVREQPIFGDFVGYAQ
jgi:hypothetical protein